MNYKDMVKYSVGALVKAGAEKSQCTLNISEKQELNVAADKISLFRTTFETNLTLRGILSDKSGSVTINKLDKNSIDEAVKEVIEIAKSSKADEANDIAEVQPTRIFETDVQEANLDLMYDRLQEFLQYSKEKYPNTILEEINFDFTKKSEYKQNSNGVDFVADDGYYNFGAMFTTKIGQKTSSFNYSGFSAKTLDKPLMECGTFETLIKQSAEQLETKSIDEKFVGDVIVTPDCMDEFLYYISGALYDSQLITKNSFFTDKLDKKVAEEIFTLHSNPISEELAVGYRITNDGYAAQNSTIIEKGILRTYLLSQYGAKKTGLKKAVNHGDCFVVDVGKTPFDEMLKSVDEGILLCRFSGGEPASNGDFSGVAKNSYYIKNGEIQYPISESMIAGNIAQMLLEIKEISQERVNFGGSILPWIKFGKLTISGK